MHNDTGRRAFLAALLAAIAPLPASARTALLCPGDPSISNLQAPLTIDTHAHFFNGRDLQIREFLSQTTVRPGSELYPLVNGIAGILQAVAWHHAPSAQQEREAMAKLLRNCSGSEQLRSAAQGAFQEGYEIGRRELQLAAKALSQTTDGAAVLAATPATVGVGDAIASLPEDYESFEKTSNASILASDKTMKGNLRFVLHHFNHRHVNAIDYLNTYSKGSPRKIDLVAASMVDYDYWLAKGKPTPTSLTAQVELMGDISVLLGGRVHGFVPFCPFREMMTIDASGIGDSMRLVRRAIEARGFIGVKLYPPMGFAAWGNTGRSEWKGKASLLPVASAPDFGNRLDASMQRLFTYCVDNDVPVMAHTNNSNGPFPDFEALAGSSYWQLALTKFPGLRVNFGHFGDTDLEDHNGARTEKFLKLMTPGAGSSGERAFADSGYFAGTMLNYDKMGDVLNSLYASENRIMLERLMYGSDWSMILTEKNVSRYLADFIKVIRNIEAAEPGIGARQTTLSNAFFGQNAMEYLALRKGRGNRVRLERFYSQNDVAEPDWMKKVDKIKV
ncbi:MAG: amidohydrolase family protein [Telluria sp.]